MKWKLSSLKNDFSKIEWVSTTKLNEMGRFVVLSIAVAGLLLAFGDLAIRRVIAILSWVLSFIFG